MKHTLPLGILVLVVSALTGCGGTTPVAGFQDATLHVYGGRGLFFSLEENQAVSESAKATVNGYPLRLSSNGGPNFKSGVNYPYYGAGQPLPDALVSREPVNAVVRLEDETGFIGAEVEKALGPYSLLPLHPAFEDEYARPVQLQPGEQLTFEVFPPLPIDAASLSVGVQTRTTEPYKSWELTPQVEGTRITVTLPADLTPAGYDIGFFFSAKPRVLRCEGIRACDASVDFLEHFDFEVH